MQTRKLVTLVALLCVVAALVACGGGSKTEAPAAPAGGASKPAPAAAAGSASITGKINFEGTAPAAKPIAMSADPFCAGAHTTPVMDETLRVANGSLENVFVYVKDGVSGSFPAPAEKAKLDQKGCQYYPHVSGLQAGQGIEIVNSDSTAHNVHAMPTKNQEFNISQPIPGQKNEQKFDQPEVMVKMKCDIHPWMSAYIGVLPHPFWAVSKADGTFEIKGLPAGTYTVEAWHEKLGAQTGQITVADGEAKDLPFTFRPAS